MPVVHNAGATVGLPGGLGSLAQGRNDVDADRWGKVAGHPFVVGLLAAGRLKVEEQEAAPPEEPAKKRTKGFRLGGKRP